ncbi:hypothetical protein N9Z47_02940 [bacterium]|jgi:hypothetical protein|nr:hypothetical protein [bacterium]
MKPLSLTVCLIVVCCGCRAITSAPMVVSPASTTNSIFDGVTHFELNVWASGTRQEGRYIISSQSEILQIERAFACAKWRPFIDTIPADSVGFRAMNGNVELFEFTFGAGWIYNWSANPGPMGKGIPSDADRKVFREIIDRARTQGQHNTG